MWAHWRHLANTIEIAHNGATLRIWLHLCFFRPTQVQKPKRQIDWFSCFCTAHSRRSILYNGRPFPPKLPFLVGIWTPSNSWFLGSFRDHSLNDMTIDSGVFAQVTAECPYTLLWAPISPKTAHFHGGPESPSNTLFLGSIQAQNPNGISIGSVVFSECYLLSPVRLSVVSRLF